MAALSNCNRGGGGPIIRTEGGVLVDEEHGAHGQRTAPRQHGHARVDEPGGLRERCVHVSRVIFKSSDPTGRRRYGMGRGPHLSWWVDFPDADLNFHIACNNFTSIRVDPDGRVLKLTDPELGNYRSST